MKIDLILKKNTQLSNALILRQSGVGLVLFVCFVKTVSLCRKEVEQLYHCWYLRKIQAHKFCLAYSDALFGEEERLVCLFLNKIELCFPNQVAIFP